MKQNSDKELERPFFSNVEEYFSEFVEFYGGKVIEKLNKNLTDRPNADYLFENPGIISELKCFEKDIFGGMDEFPKIEKLLNKWTDKKMISDDEMRNHIFKGGPLPPICAKDIIETASKTIERAIYKGNKQIETSKLTFNLPNSKGVLFLLNNGNYYFNNHQFLKIISIILGRKFRNPAFDVVIYLTLNQTSRNSTNELDYMIWVPLYTRIDENGLVIEDKELIEFVNDIGRKYSAFYEKKTGEEIIDKKEFNDSEKGMDEIKKLKYVPKKIIYKK